MLGPGPAVIADPISSFFGVLVGAALLGCKKGLFSTAEVDAGLAVTFSPGAPMTGSGREGMESSGDEVSIVKFLVFKTPSRTV